MGTVLDLPLGTAQTDFMIKSLHLLFPAFYEQNKINLQLEMERYCGFGETRETAAQET